MALSEPTFGMRTSENRNEYIESIGIIFLENSDIFIWQNFNGPKMISRVSIHDILPEKNSLMLVPQELSFPNFHRSKDIYFKAVYKDMLFKSKPGEYQIEPRKLKVTFPDKVFYQEMREHQRLSLEHSALDIFADLDKGGQRLKYKVRNISAHGMGLVADIKKKDFFKPGTSLKMDKVGGFNLKEELEGKVVYCHIVSGIYQTFLEVGLEFKEKVPAKLLLDLTAHRK